MTRTFALALLLGLGATLSGCGSDRRSSGYRPPNDGCTRGSLLPCNCADGADGFSTCDGTSFGACVCDGSDAGTSNDDAGTSTTDAGFIDGGGTPPFDAGFPDAGFFDSGVPFDSGIRPDAGFLDSGIRPDAGFPDSGIRPDAGFPDSGTPPGPCNSDSECGPPFAVCEQGQCTGGCISGDPNGLVCAVPEDCNPLTGRCDGLGICVSDADCNPPVTVCGLFFCMAGCAQPGAAACAAGTTCNAATGHCR